MKIRSSVVGAFALAFVPMFTWAGGVAVIEAGADSQYMRSTIEFDGDRIRMEMAEAGMEGYMLMRDGSVYSVTNQGGQPFVMDLGAMMNMLGGLVESQASLGAPISDLITVEATGRTEQVAGISGQVFNVTYTDEDGQQRTDEVVIGSHPALRDLSRSLESWSRAMAANMNTDVSEYEDTMAQLLTRGDGILRMGSHYRLVSIDGNTPASSRFELPAAPQQMPNLGALMSGAMDGGQAQPAQTEAAAETQSNNPVGNFFNRRAQRQQERVENRAEQEVDQAERAVDNAVDRAIDNIFRRF